MNPTSAKASAGEGCVAIVGCGLIGQKRAKALGPARLVCCVDSDLSRAQALARTAPGADALTDWRHAVARTDVDIVIVATTNDALAPIATAAVQAGKHVLVEKPAARSLDELEGVLAAAKTGLSLVRVGFNHRYHPALRKAREIVDSGALRSAE